MSVLAGDVTTDPLPADHDAFLVANLVHYWSPDENKQMLTRMAQAAAPGARLMLADFWTTRRTPARCTRRSWPASLRYTSARATCTASTRRGTGWPRPAGRSSSIARWPARRASSSLSLGDAIIPAGPKLSVPPAYHLKVGVRRLRPTKRLVSGGSPNNTLRPHEAIAWNRPKELHLGVADPKIPTFQATEILPST
ncbi:MAG: methyltransferase [Geodermatophilaceae bacterium]